VLGLGMVQSGFRMGCHWHGRVWDAGSAEGGYFCENGVQVVYFFG